MSLPVGVEVSRPEVQDAQRDVLLFEPGDDLQHIRDRSREAVEFGHHEDVALADEVDPGIDLRTGRDARHLFLENPLDAGRAKVTVLSFEADDLLRRACPGISGDHGPLRSTRLRS